MGPDSFQWCPVTGEGESDTNWSIGCSVWTWGRISSLWGWRSTGTGCPGRLWGLLLWRYSRPAWTRCSAACCRWPCFGRGVGLDDPQRSLPTPTILWFCNSVNSFVWTQYSSVETDRYVRFRNAGENVLVLYPIFLSYESSNISCGSVIYYQISHCVTITAIYCTVKFFLIRAYISVSTRGACCRFVKISITAYYIEKHVGHNVLFNKFFSQVPGVWTSA